MKIYKIEKRIDLLLYNYKIIFIIIIFLKFYFLKNK